MSEVVKRSKTQMIKTKRYFFSSYDHTVTNACLGFSTIELLITVLIMLVVSAIAIPNFMRELNSYKLASTARSVSDLIERTRYEAIKRNTKITCHFTLGATPPSAWIDLNGTGVLANNDPKVVYSTLILSTGTVLPGAASMGFPGVTAVAPTGTITFDSRGAVDYTGVAGGQTVWALYFTYNNDVTYGAKAISVEPMGRSKTWSGTPGSSSWTTP